MKKITLFLAIVLTFVAPFISPVFAIPKIPTKTEGKVQQKKIVPKKIVVPRVKKVKPAPKKTPSKIRSKVNSKPKNIVPWMEPPLPSETQVMINRKKLTASQLEEVKSAYGVEPKAGNYWYDSVSGLYGTFGQPASGFMRPGHDFGSLPANASSGNTGVFINGREAASPEVGIIALIIGAPVQPGRYFLDGQGNVGYEGTGVTLLNLYIMASAAASSGGGRGGDNFWSTRFSAGNSNADNSQGYVSVPGYGPVGYGF